MKFSWEMTEDEKRVAAAAKADALDAAIAGLEKSCGRTPEQEAAFRR